MSNLFDIQINGEFIEMDPDTQLTLDFINPLFSGEYGYNSQSFSFNVPNTPHNRKLMGRGDIVSSKSKQYSIDATFWLFGREYAEVIIKVNTANPRAPYSVAILLETAAFTDRIKDKTLREFAYSPAVISTEEGSLRADAMKAHAKATAQGDVGDYDYVFFPLYNRTMYGSRHSSEKVVNKWNEVTKEFETNFILSEVNSLNPHSICPFPYVIAVLRKIMEESGYVLDESIGWPTDPEVRRLAIFNQTLLDDGWSITIDVQGNPETLLFNQFKGSINLADHLP